MTTTKSPAMAASRRAIAPDAVRMGQWAFVPGMDRSVPDGGHASLQYGGRCVELRYSSSVVEDLLTTIGRLQDEFARRSGTGYAPSAASRDEWTGNIVHV
ncbi:hypothetical protein [Streptomyces sp. NPDC001985]|uniref:hypothetical protein n=1 Tax=Streptomyces sp. NPDC001985 TaxID=3154406 RepID=UPI0033203B91